MCELSNVFYIKHGKVKRFTCNPGFSSESMCLSKSVVLVFGVLLRTITADSNDKLYFFKEKENKSPVKYLQLCALVEKLHKSASLPATTHDDDDARHGDSVMSSPRAIFKLASMRVKS